MPKSPHDAELTALDFEFTYGGQMQVSVYHARREKLVIEREQQKDLQRIGRMGHGTYSEMQAQPLREQVTALQRRISLLEARPEMRWVGTWTDGSRYSEQNVVTCHGCLYIAKRATHERPGSGSKDWQLCVQKGRDGNR